MTGTSHIHTNIATAIGCTAGIILAHTCLASIGCTARIIEPILFLQRLFVSPWSESYFAIPYYVVGAVCFIFGTLLPDIDSKNSTIGRVIHIPIEHRTWTHTIWALLPFVFASVFCPVMIYLTAGYFGHLLWDSASKMGVCWFYPISRYRRFGCSGAKIKNGHRCYLYETGNGSEQIVVLFTWIIAAIMCYCVIFMAI